LDIDDYVFNVTQDGYLDSYIQDLVDAYYKIKPSIRKQITKSCFKLSTDYKINQDLTEDGNYWIEGTLKITIHFQSDDKYFGCPWWKKIFKPKA
jgi:beta-lactamase class D